MKRPKYTPCPVCGRPYIGLKAHIQDTYDDAHTNYRKEHGIKAGNNCKPKLTIKRITASRPKPTTKPVTTSRNEKSISKQIQEPEKTELKYFTPEHPELGRKTYPLKLSKSRFHRKKKNKRKSNKSNNKSIKSKPQISDESPDKVDEIVPSDESPNKLNEIIPALYNLVMDKQGKINLTPEQKDACFTVLEGARKAFGLPEGTSYAAIYESYQAHLKDLIKKSEEYIRKLNEAEKAINDELRRRKLKRLDERRHKLVESFEEIKNKNPEINGWISKIELQSSVIPVFEENEDEKEKERISRLRHLLNGGGI